MRRLGAGIAAVVLASGTLLSITTGPAAAWAPHCDDGQRSTAKYWADTAQFTTPKATAWVDGTAYNKVELRYNSAARCVWALYNGGKEAKVYIDRSRNGGATWDGWLGTQGPSKSTYTGVYNDYSPYASRACASYAGRFYCTGWY